MKYTVDVDRENDSWLAFVRDLQGAHTYARNLPSLRKAVEEVIRLVTDTPDDEPVEFELSFRNVPEQVRQAAADAEERDRFEAALLEAQVAISAWIGSLTDAGFSARDVAGIVKISPGRVTQVLAGKRDALDGIALVVPTKDEVRKAQRA